MHDGMWKCKCGITFCYGRLCKYIQWWFGLGLQVYHPKKWDNNLPCLKTHQISKIGLPTYKSSITRLSVNQNLKLMSIRKESLNKGSQTSANACEIWRSIIKLRTNNLLVSSFSTFFLFFKHTGWWKWRFTVTFKIRLI